MKFKMVHENYNVQGLQRSLDFYEAALGLKEKRRKTAADGSFIIVYVGNDETDTVVVDTEEVVEIAAHVAGRVHRGSDLELTGILRKWRKDTWQDGLLDFPGHGQVALQQL